jgi:hypothetical protein
MKRAIASGAAVVGIATAAMGAGIATQPAAPAPVVLATDAETAQQDAIARVVAEMTRDEDPEGWDSRYGDGT